MAANDERQVEEAVHRLLELMDAMDMGGVAAMFTDDAQGIDEIARQWTRGRTALNAYLSQVEGSVSDVHSELSDVHASAWADTGLVTFVLDQTYTMDGAPQTLTAPTTAVFRREDDTWKVALIHSVPLPEAPAG